MREEGRRSARVGAQDGRRTRHSAPRPGTRGRRGRSLIHADLVPVDHDWRPRCGRHGRRRRWPATGSPPRSARKSVTYANQLALLATRQIEPACGHISRIARRSMRRARVLPRAATAAAVSAFVITFAAIVNVTWIPHSSSFNHEWRRQGPWGAGRTMRPLRGDAPTGWRECWKLWNYARTSAAVTLTAERLWAGNRAREATVRSASRRATRRSLVDETEQGQITDRRAVCQFTETDGNGVPAVELLCQT